MSTERDTARIVRSWLENGVTDLPDRVLDAVLEQLPATPQRHPWWSARRYFRMNNPLKLAIAAGAVFTVGIIGLNLLPGTTEPRVGAPASTSPTPVASPSPSPSASPGSPALGTGPLSPGRYFLDVALTDWPTTYQSSNRVPGGTARVSFDLPAGWAGEAGWVVMKHGAEPPDGLAVAALTINDNVYIEPCRWEGAEARNETADSPLLGSLDGLAEAVSAWWGVGAATGPTMDPGTTFPPTRPTATKPVNATVDGRDARYVEVRTPADIDITSCDGGQYTLFSGRYVQGPGELDRLWIVDVKGTGPETPGGLLVIDAPSHPGTSPADLAEQQAVIDSIRIELIAGS